MKARRGFILPLCLLVGVTSITFGAVRGWRYHHEQKERAFQGAILMRQIASAGVYTQVLLSIESEEYDKARTRLRFYLESAMVQADKLTSQGIDLEGAHVYLRDQLKQASQYGKSHDLAVVATSSDAVFLALFRAESD